MKNLFSITAVLLTFGGATIATTVSEVYTGFYTFGDSLSDDGKVGPDTDPYVGNRFTNGETWSELFANAFADGQETKNYARGGATAGGEDNMSSIPNLRNATFAGQRGLFADDQAINIPGENPLIATWFGANDLLAIPEGSSTDVAEEFAQLAAIDFADGIRDLYNSDQALYDDFLVLNLPDIGRTPRFNGSPLSAGTGSFISGAFNTQLIEEIGLLEADGINVIEFDVAGAVDAILDDPATAGFENLTQSCLSFITSASDLFCGTDDPATVDEFLFIDDIHPTQNAHQTIAEQTLAEVENSLTIAPVPLPASAPMLLAGFALLGWQARRRRAA